MKTCKRHVELQLPRPENGVGLRGTQYVFVCGGLLRGRLARGVSGFVHAAHGQH